MASLLAVLRNAFSRPLSLELENKGSVARDHLALERTFLAWLRTSLGLVSLGIALVQLFKIPDLFDEETSNAASSLLSLLLKPPLSPSSSSASTGPHDGASSSHPSYANVLADSPDSRDSDLTRLAKPLGASFIALGIVVLVLGSYRYFTVQTILTRGKFLPSRVEISIVALMTGALTSAALAIVIRGRIEGT